ncbi:hypothetical protein MHYP_G00092790 [Metynnis hypsauchen]
MDVTSGFYNIEMAEEDKKLTAFTTPMDIHEFNRLPQGLCNSPASFMRLMMNVFGDQNFLTLLCYLDDLLVFAPNEEEALKRLEMVFGRLRDHGLKLAPKKCYLLRRSVRFLGHIVDVNGVATDPDKVKTITSMSEADLMLDDGVTPSQRKIKSFLDGPMTGPDSCRINRTASWVAEAIASSSRPGSQNSLIPENDLSEVDSDTSAIKSQLSYDTGAEDASEKGCDAEGGDVTHETLRDVDSVCPVIGEEGVGTIPPSLKSKF